MSVALGELDQMIARLADRAIFSGPAALGEIEALESALNTTLPQDYKAFLLSHNGGFVSLLAYGKGDRRWNEGTAAWNSNTFMSCKGVLEEFEEQRDIWALDREWLGKWPYIPILHTSSQEWLVLGPSPEDDRSIVVLDAFHELGPGDWRTLHRSFSDLLDAYIIGEGNLGTIA